MKINIATMTVTWTYQFVSEGGVATHCVASDEMVYVVGHVPINVLELTGANQTETTSTRHTRDIFASRLDATSGSVQWTEFLDSHYDDYVSGAMMEAGGDLVVSATAVNQETGQSRIWLNSLSKTDGYHNWKGLPDSVDPVDFATMDDSSPTTAENNLPEKKNNKKAATITLATVIPCLLLVFVIIYTIRWGRSYHVLGDDDDLHQKSTDDSSQASSSEGPKIVACGDDGKIRQIL